ncbi:hypothetical protein BC827DRAFT_927477 [Russula dissimulans]|nr:hypothetical protein BC827DRAFT_927477 [Russula dissimulans]
MERMMRLHCVLLLSVLTGLGFGQVTYPNCTAAGWEWVSDRHMFSFQRHLNQNPCNVAASLASTCGGGQLNIPPLLPSAHYNGPPSGGDNLCQCNTVVYSLISACGGCQNSTWMQWSQWSYNCTAESSPSTYPDAIPAGTRVPHWAYLDVTVCYALYVFRRVILALRMSVFFPEMVQIADNWSATAAKSAGDSPEVKPTPVSTVQVSPTASAVAQTSRNKSHSGEIAGAVARTGPAGSIREQIGTHGRCFWSPEPRPLHVNWQVLRSIRS